MELFWSAFSRIPTEYGKMRTRITPNTEKFYAVSFAELQWRNGGGVLSAISLSLRESCHFLEEHKNRFIIFVLPHSKFCPALKKCYYLSVVLKISIWAAKLARNKRFKGNASSMAFKSWWFCFAVFIFEVFLALTTLILVSFW